MDRDKSTDRANERRDEEERERELDRTRGNNPPRTTTGNMTAPKFGSATSGGGELEPGPERD